MKQKSMPVEDGPAKTEGGIAQLVEQRTFNSLAVGSYPTAPTESTPGA